jgi:hypothetical protein
MSIAGKLQTIAENEQRVYDAGKTEGIEEGKQAEYDRFWTTHLSKAQDGIYAYAGKGWDDETFNPPRGTVIQPTYAYGMFFCTSITDLAALCEEKEITLDFSKSTNFTQTFYGSGNARLTRIGVVDTTNSAGLSQPFRGQSNLHTIDKLILKADGTQTFTDMFRQCSYLVNIVIEGTIGQNGFDASPCTRLSHDSLMSILNAARNCTIILGTTNLEKLSVAEKAGATEKGVTLA